ncbi:uncharacterized protein LOC127706731 [Mytilus californianus]|uniref:uncharacterized protein LOC127706731 n=1 Tax=Mytilus californianus TaxID=6549 RepID=UPI00224756BC|nr:uncharacterized protein LOC127706731 [Mytilus californianus]
MHDDDNDNRVYIDEEYSLHIKNATTAKQDNLVYYTSWGDWTPCSVCGAEGERKRRGGGAGKKFASVKLDKIEFQNVMKKFPETTVIATEGDRVDLICPGSSIDTLVYWIKGTKYMSSLKLREETSDRVDIDAYNVFVIHTSLMEDSRSYTCAYAGRTRMIFHLKVLPPPGLPPWVEHLLYLCYSFTVDFWVFVIFLAVRHKHRLVAHTTKRFKPQRYEDANNNEEVQNMHPENEALLPRDFDKYLPENEVMLANDFDEFSTENEVVLASDFDEFSTENEVLVASDFGEYSTENEVVLASDFDEYSEYEEEDLMPNNKYNNTSNPDRE